MITCMKKILIISDTHGTKKQIRDVISKENPDYSIHAGDFCIDIDFMKENFSYFVAGNNDNEGNDIVEFTIDNIKFVLIHGHQIISFFSFYNAKLEKLNNFLLEKKGNVLIFGHTHIEMFQLANNSYILNPGSLVFPRNNSGKKTYIILHIDNGKILEKNLNDAIKYYYS